MSDSRLTKLENQLLHALETAKCVLSFGIDANEAAYLEVMKEVNEAIRAAENKTSCLQCAGSGMIILGDDVEVAEFVPCACVED